MKYFIVFLALQFVFSYGFSKDKIYSYKDSEGRIVITDIPKVNSGYKNKKRKTQKSDYRYSYSRTLKSKNTKINQLIKKYANEHGLSEKLIHALIKTESDYDIYAVSKKGAKGLMQLMPETGNMYKVKNLFDPEQNIKAGVKHLKMLYDKFYGNLELTLAAYNAGETAVAKFDGIPPYKETENYVTKIMRLYEGKYYTIPGSLRGGVKKKVSNIYKYYDESGVLTITNIYPGDKKIRKRVK